MNKNFQFSIFNFQFKKGFTLIELLVAISIIGVLSALLLANMLGVRQRARDAQRKSDLKQVETALRLYYNDNQSYPPSDSGNIAGGACKGSDCSWGSSLLGTDEITYMKELPQDPLQDPLGSDSSYFYERGADTDTFSLYAYLENRSDTDGTESCGSSGYEWCFAISAD